MTRTASVRMFCLLAAILAASGIASAQQDDRALSSIPAGTLAYVSIDIQKLRQFWDQVKGSTLGRLITEEMAKGKGKGADASLSQAMEMLSQAFSGQVAIALADEKVVPGQVPSVAFVIPTKGQQEAQALITVLQMQLKSENAELSTREYQGTTVTTISGGKLKKAPITYALQEDRLLAATKPAWLEKAIDATAGRIPRLTAVEDFEQVRSRLGSGESAQGWFWVNTQRFNEVIYEAAEETAPKPQAEGEAGSKPRVPPFKLDALKPMLEAYGGTGGTLEMSPQGLLVEGFTLIRGNTEFGRKILAQRGAPLRSADLTSGHAILYAGCSDIPFMVDTMRMLIAAMGAGDLSKNLAGMAQSFQSATGLDLQRDLLDYIGSEAALVLNDLPSDLKTVPVLLYLQATDTSSLGKMMQKLRAHMSEGMGIRFISKEIPQGRYYYMKPDGMPLPIAPGWTFARDFLVIGAVDYALKSPLYRANDQGTSLAQNPQFQRAVGLRGDRLTSIFFLNLGKLTSLIDKIPPPSVRRGGRAPNLEQAKKVMGVFRTLSFANAVGNDALSFRINLEMDLTN